MSLFSSIQGLGGSFLDNVQKGGGMGGGEASALSALRRMQKQSTGATGESTGAGDPLQGLSLEKLSQMANGEIQRLGKQATAALEANRPSASPITGPSNTADASQSFATMLGDLVDSVDQKHKTSAKEARDLMLGKSENIHQAMIAMQEASVAFGLLVEVRNKLVESYKELTRMQV